MVKDKVLTPSTALRHTAEMLSYLRERSPAVRDCLCVESDGGPDRNPNTWSVRLGLIALFSLSKVPALTVFRTAPGQSYRERCERTMVSLNYCLGSVSLARSTIEDSIVESKVSQAGSLQDMRDCLSSDPRIEAMYTSSMKAPLELVQERVRTAVYDKKNVTVATTDVSAILLEIANHLKQNYDIDEPLLSRKAAEQNDQLMNFWTKHVTYVVGGVFFFD